MDPVWRTIYRRGDPFQLVKKKKLFHLVLLLIFFISKCTADLPILEYKEYRNCNEIRKIEDGLNGTIKTVGYPGPYPVNSYCEIQLRGNATHRVLIRFKDFYLHHPSGKKHNKTSCDGLDKLQIYDGIREEAILLDEFCGRGKPRSVMSSGSNLTLNLTSYSSGPDAKGFLASYAFVSNFGITSGVQIDKYNCSFFYGSEEKKGWITTPNPGGNYPRNTNCTYNFKGHYEERILLKFNYFDLEGIEPCTARSGSDYLEFSSLPGIDPCPARRCGRFAPQEVISEGPYFKINFYSNDKLDGIGFNASYEFVNEDRLPKWVTSGRNSAGLPNGDVYVLFFLLFLALRFSFSALM